MFQRRFMFVALVGLIVLVLLFGAVSAGQRDAWTQGYMMGRLSAGTDGANSAAPLLPYMYGGQFGLHPFFGGFGLLLLIGGLFLFFGVARCFRFHAWGMHGGPWAHGPEGQAPSDQQQARGWGRRGYGPPPWWHGWEHPEEKSQPAPDEPESGAKV